MQIQNPINAEKFLKNEGYSKCMGFIEKLLEGSRQIKTNFSIYAIETYSEEHTGLDKMKQRKTLQLESKLR